MVGSGTLTWPKDKTDRLAMHVSLLRSLSNGALDVYDFCRAFLYSANDYNVHVQDISRQLFLPTTRELIRYIEQYFDAADIPVSDRIVTINHNSKEYADADAAMEKLEKAIREANDFDDPLEKEQREAEVSAARRILQATRVRVSVIAELLKPLVTQYATKLKDNLVSIAVSGTISALVYIFGKIF